MADLYGEVVFGQLTSSDTSTANNGTRKLVISCVLGSDSPIDGLVIKSTVVSANAKVMGVIYADNAGAPGALLHVTNELEGIVTEDNYLYFASQINLVAGTYWLGIISDTSFGIRCSFVNSFVYNTNSYTDGPSDPFGAFTTSTYYGLYIGAFRLETGSFVVSKATGCSVLSPTGVPIPKALAYAVLSTEVTVSISKALAYAVLEPAVEEVQSPFVFIIT
jgi:hypothetical protein